MAYQVCSPPESVRHIGIGRLRRDGFASLSPINETGWLVTPVLERALGRSELILNLDCTGGNMRVIILAADDPSAQLATSTPLANVSSTAWPVSFGMAKMRETENLSRLRLRFELEGKCALYSFWFAPSVTFKATGGWPNGAPAKQCRSPTAAMRSWPSMGEVAGGGPSFKGDIADRDQSWGNCSIAAGGAFAELANAC